MKISVKIKRIVILLMLMLFASIFTSCGSSGTIDGKWGYVCDTYHGLDAKGISMVFDKDGKFVIARDGVEINGTWQEVPTTDETKKKYEIIYNGDSDFLVLDKKTSVLSYDFSSSETWLFAQNDSQKKMAMNTAYESVYARQDYSAAIELAKALNKSQNELDELNSQYLAALKESDPEAALAFAESIQQPEGEVDDIKIGLLNESLEKGDINAAKNYAQQLNDNELYNKLSLYEKAYAAEEQDLQDALTQYEKIDLEAAQKRIKELKQCLNTLGMYSGGEYGRFYVKVGRCYRVGPDFKMSATFGWTKYPNQPVALYEGDFEKWLTPTTNTSINYEIRISRYTGNVDLKETSGSQIVNIWNCERQN